MENTIKLSRRIKITFMGAIVLTAVVMIALQNLVEKKISKQVFDAQVINISGRQRMYSQKITKTILLLDRAKDSVSYYAHLKTLQKDVQTWNAAHRALLHRSKLPAGEPVFIPGENSPEMEALIQHHAPYHQAMLKAITLILTAPYAGNHAQQASFHRAIDAVLAQEPFVLDGRDAITRQYIAESANKIEQLDKLVKLITVILLLLLVLEGLLIFWPLERVIKNFVHQLNNKLVELHAHQEQMYAIQHELSQLNSFQSAILENAVVSIISTDPKGIITSINPTVSRWLGYQPDELIGVHTPEIFHQLTELQAYASKIAEESGLQTTSGMEAIMQKAADGYKQQEEFTYIRKDGSACVLLLNISAIFNNSGEINGYLYIGVDVTDKKKVEQQLKQSEQLYRLISENSLDLVRLHNLDGTYAYVSPSVFNLLGYWPDELTGKSTKDIVHPDDYESIISHSKGILATKSENESSVEYRVRRKDGEYIWPETFAKPIIDDAGTVILLQTSSRDITRRKQAQDALEKSELRLKEAQKLAHIGNWEFDLLTGAMSWSDEVYAIHGRNIQDSLPSFEEFVQQIHPEDRHILIRDSEKAVTHGLDYNHDTRIILPGGQTKWVNALGKVSKDLQGKTVKVYGTVMDITERKAKENELNQISSLLNSVLDSSLSGIMAFRSVRDDNQRIVDFEWLMLNKQAEKLTGRSASGLTGKRLLEQMPGNRTDGLFDMYVQVVENNQPVNQEHFYDHEGIRTWFHTVAVKLQDGFVVTFSDITDNKLIELEKDILDKQLKLQKFALDAAAIVAITDKYGVITYANERFCNISGYTKAELIGKTHQLVNSGYHSRGFFKDMWQQISAGCMWRGEICNLAKDGSQYWVDTIIVPFLDAHGQPYQYMAIRFDITSKKEAENNLSSALARLSAIIGNMQAGILVEDEHNRIALVNTQFCNLFSIPLSPEDMIGMSSVNSADSYKGAFMDQHSFTERIKSICKENLPVSQEELILKNTHVLERDYIPIFVDSIYKGHVWLYRDITARKQAENQLVESTRLINALFSNSPLAIQIYDRHGFSMRMNEAQRRLLGVPDLDYGVNQFNVLTDPLQNPASYNKHFKRAYEGETVILSDQSVDFTNGSYQGSARKPILYYDQIIFPIIDQSGSVEAVVSFMQDVTYKMVARVELEETKRFLESIINAIPNFLYVFDIETSSLVYANPEMVQMLSYSENELQHMGSSLIPQLVHPDDITPVQAYLQNFRHVGEGLYHIEFNIKNNKNEYRLLQTRDVPFKRNARGYVCQVIGIAQDITDLRKAELELQEAYKGLQVSEEELRQRGEELQVMNEVMEKTILELKNTQSQLVQSEKMASLGQLTAGIAHEINNPVNFIYAGIANLRESLNEIFDLLKHYDVLADFESIEEVQAGLAYIQELKEELYYKENLQVITETLQSVENGASRTAEIVKGLRNFSRLDEAAIKQAFAHEGLDNTLVLLTNQYRDRIRIIKEYDPNLQSIECYPGQLNQVFMNILTNAIQAIEGEGQIEIATFNLPQYVRIYISDSGKGMPESVREKIFEPFFTTKPVGQGTGLGLSISYGIIQKHNGEIHVESQPGQGTAFVITLPKVLSTSKNKLATT